MNETIRVNPFRCRVWEAHARMEEYVTEESCREEIRSMQKGGQLVAAIGRRVQGDPMHEVEVICGTRRLFAARHLNAPLGIEIRGLSDRETAILLDIENRQRRDLSAYERGRSFSRWISTGCFESQEDIADALKISRSQVSRLVKVSKLPSVVVEAFGNPADICEAWGTQLHAVCKDEKKRPQIMARARSVQSHPERPPAHAVFSRLMVGANAPQQRLQHKHEVVIGPSGRPLFRIKHHQQAVALLIDRKSMSTSTLAKIKDAVSQILQNGISQPAVDVEISADSPNKIRSGRVIGGDSTVWE
jgi:ParB family transcriptional regulator, chromosome partitioning protein